MPFIADTSLSASTKKSGRFVPDSVFSPKPRKDIINAITGGEELIPEKNWVARGMYQTGKDITNIPAHFANQFLLDYPRRITEHKGYEYPSGTIQGENVLGLMKRKPVAGTLAGIAGIAGGIKNPIFQALGGGIGAGLGRNILAGGGTGLAYSPSKFESPGQVAGEQIQKVIGGAVLPVAGKAISKVAPMISGFGKNVVSKGAGLSKTAINTVGRLGFKKVREVADKGINYLQEDVIPRARQSLIKNITSAGEASKELLQDMGFNPDQIKNVMKISKQNMNKYGKMISESWVKTEKNLGDALNTVGKQIGNVYTQAAKEGRRINIKNTIGTMRKQLKSMGVVDDEGNLLGDYKTHPSSAVKNLAQIYSDYAPRIGKGKMGMGDISVPDFLNLKTRLQASIVKFPEGEKFNVPIYITNKVLKEDNINSLIQKGSPYEKFWRDLNKEYSDLETLDYLTKKITIVANNLPNKILTQRNKLTEKHMKLYGKDIVNDVDAYNAARELYPEKETFSIFNPQKPLIRGAYKGTEMLKEATRPITAPIGRTVQKVGQFGKNKLQQYMEAPLVSPKTKSFFAQAPSQVGAKLKGKSGQAIFGKEEPQKPVFGVKPQEPTPTTPIQKPIVKLGLIPQIDNLQGKIDVYIAKGEIPPKNLIDEINNLKAELRRKPIEISGIKTKVLGSPPTAAEAVKQGMGAEEFVASRLKESATQLEKTGDRASSKYYYHVSPTEQTGGLKSKPFGSEKDNVVWLQKGQPQYTTEGYAYAIDPSKIKVRVAKGNTNAFVHEGDIPKDAIIPLGKLSKEGLTFKDLEKRIFLSEYEATKKAQPTSLVMPPTEIIPYSKDLNIKNLEILPKGTGAGYLEVIKGEGNSYIAKQWRRSPTEGKIIIDFKTKKQ